MTEQIAESVQDSVEQNGNLVLPEITVGDLPAHWLEAMQRMGWSQLMPVQAKAIPYLIAGQDLMVQSRTGSGKTGAFLFPLLEKINPLQASCQTLILVPTRELALQVFGEAETLFRGTRLRVAVVYGGVRYGGQLEALRNGAHIVIGTPGRVLDHLLRKSLVLDSVRFLVLDEADRMLSMGFYPDMKEIQRFLPSGRRVETHLFSATYPPYVLRLAKEFLHKPVTLSLSQEHIHVTEIEHLFYTVPALDKDRALIRIIEIENPANAIIFCNTKAKVHYLTIVLQRFGYDAAELSADLSQSDREKVMSQLRKGDLRFLVATDVAARGIDIPELSHVFQYEPPEDPEGYIHRAGRTGRAGATGEAITLVDVVEKLRLKSIAKQYGVELVERPLPSDEDVQTVVSQRLTALLEAQLRGRDKLQVERQKRFTPLVRTLIEDEDALILVAMVLDDRYQELMHKPLKLPAHSPHSPSSSSTSTRRRKSRP